MSLRTGNQAHCDRTEIQVARRYLDMIAEAGVKVTFFVSGRSFAEEWDDLSEPLHMSVRTFCALAREVWSRSASSEVVCPACLGEGVVTDTISDFTGFADDIEADVVCSNCKGEGSWS